MSCHVARAFKPRTCVRVGMSRRVCVWIALVGRACRKFDRLLPVCGTHHPSLRRL